MIEITDLTKSYGTVQALRGVSFTIGDGEIVGLLGPNGAGKTTIMKILTGYLQPDSGTVYVDNLNVLNHPREAQTRIGYLPENAPLYPDLNVQTYLKMMADIRQIPPDEKQARISDAVHSLNLEDYLTRPIGKLSKGYRQRVGIAQAILHLPKILVLDEPTIGLDPTQIIEIRKLVKRLSKHSTVLFSSHILPEVEALCDRAIIIMNGEIKSDSRLEDLAVTQNAILVLEKEAVDVKNVLQRLEGVSKVETFRTLDGYPAFRITGKEGFEMSPVVFHLAAKENWPLRELKRDVRTLETVFNELAIAA